MANGFDYESPINRLLSVTIPQFLESQLNRQEQSRQFDEKMASDAEAGNRAQQRWDQEFKLKEDQYKKSNTIENRKINLSEDQLLFSSYTDYDTIEEKRTALEKGGLAFKTDLFKNKAKVELANLDKISTSNKKEIEMYTKIDPRLGQIASARVDYVDMGMDDQVLKYLQIQGVQNASRGTAIIANYTTMSKLWDDAPGQLATQMISQDEFNSRKSNYQSAQQALNDYIKGDPALSSASPVDDSGGNTVIAGAADGSIANPYQKDNLPSVDQVSPGDVMEVGEGDGRALFIAGDDGMWTELPAETPATPEYIVSPSERQELEKGLAGIGEPLGFLEKAADDFAPILRYSPKQSYKAVKNFEVESDKAYGELVDRRETGKGGRRTFTKEEGSPEYEASATKLQDLIQNGYNLYLRTDPDTKGGKILRKRLRKRIQRYKNIAKAALKKGRSIETGTPRGGYSVFSQSPDLIQLLDSIEF